MTETPVSQDAPPVVGVIDPDPVARERLRGLLQGVGVDVATFDSAEGYLLAAADKNFACLIVDLLLPGMSGLEFLRRLRSAGNDIPLVLLTDESDVPTAVAASGFFPPGSTSRRRTSAEMARAAASGMGGASAASAILIRG